MIIKWYKWRENFCSSVTISLQIDVGVTLRYPVAEKFEAKHRTQPVKVKQLSSLLSYNN